MSERDVNEWLEDCIVSFHARCQMLGTAFMALINRAQSFSTVSASDVLVEEINHRRGASELINLIDARN